jgi:hypothetical protein
MTGIIKDEVSTYVEFDSKAGTIISITSFPQSENYIEVDYNSVKDIADGKENPKHYKVVFNPTSLVYELKNVYDETHFEYNVNHSLYCVPKSKNADILLVKDYKNNNWHLQFGELFSKTLKKNNVTLQTVKHFSIVKKNDPYILQRTLSFNLASNELSLQFNDTDAIINEYDVYTNKMFNSYGVFAVE